MRSTSFASLWRRLALSGCFLLSGVLLACEEGGSVVLRNLSSETLRVQILFVKVAASDQQATGCPIVGFSLIPNEAVGKSEAGPQGRVLSMQEYLYDPKECEATLELPQGYSLETGQFGKGELMVEAKLIVIRSQRKSVSFQKLDFGFRKLDPQQNLYVWDYGWGS